MAQEVLVTTALNATIPANFGEEPLFVDGKAGRKNKAVARKDICEHNGSIPAHLMAVVNSRKRAGFKPAPATLALKLLEHQAGVLAPKAEAVGKGHIDILYPGYIGHIV